MAQKTSKNAVMGTFQTRGDDFLHLIDTKGLDLGGIDQTGAGYGLLQGGLIPPATKALYVDGTRTDSYTADGSILKPFKTIMAAVNQIIANGDNSTTVPYLIDIVGSGVYNETVDLGNSAIVNLIIDGHSAVSIVGANSNADCMKSLANNNGFINLVVVGVIFGSQLSATAQLCLNFSSPTNNTTMFSLQALFLNCTFSSSGAQNSVSCNNVGDLIFQGCGFIGSFSLTNVNNCVVIGGQGQSSQTSGTTTLVTNNGLPVPVSFTGTILQVRYTQWFSNITLDAGSTLADYHAFDMARNGTITVNGTYLSQGSVVRGNIVVNNGGTYIPRGQGSLFSGTLTINSGGSLAPAGTVITGAAILGSAAPTAQAGQVGLGSGTATTATTGAQTLPANPAGFLIINVAGTTQKIPYYNN